MKIALVCPATPRNSYTGLEEVSLRLAVEYSRKGHMAEIFCTSPEPKSGKVQGVIVKEHPAFAPQNNYFFSPALFSSLGKSGAGVIHCNGYNNLTLIAALLAKKNGQRLVVFANRTGSTSLVRKALTIPFDILVNLLSGRIDVLACASEEEMRNMKKALFLIPEKKFALVRNGVDKKEISKVKVSGVKSRRKGDYIISAGRLVEHKGFQHVIAGFAQALEEKPGLKLVILGHGPFRERLEALCSRLGVGEKVDFPGTIPFSRRAEFIRKIKGSSAFVFLSSIEANPLVVPEAICAGVPVILYNKGVLSEYVENNKCIGVENPADKQEVSRKILQAVSNPSGSRPDAKGLKEWKQVAEEFLELYKPP